MKTYVTELERFGTRQEFFVLIHEKAAAESNNNIHYMYKSSGTWYPVLSKVFNYNRLLNY